MQSNLGRLLLSAAAVTVVVVAFFLLREDGDEDPGAPAAPAPVATAPGDGDGRGSKGRPSGSPAEREPQVPTIVVKEGAPEGGVLELELEKGDPVRFVVQSDVDERIHVHGYDIEKDVSAGGETEIEFTADLEGVYEVELENSAVPIAKLTVAS